MSKTWQGTPATCIWVNVSGATPERAVKMVSVFDWSQEIKKKKHSASFSWFFFPVTFSQMRSAAEAHVFVQVTLTLLPCWRCSEGPTWSSYPEWAVVHCGSESWTLYVNEPCMLMKTRASKISKGKSVQITLTVLDESNCRIVLHFLCIVVRESGLFLTEKSSKGTVHFVLLQRRNHDFMSKKLLDKMVDMMYQGQMMKFN